MPLDPTPRSPRPPSRPTRRAARRAWARPLDPSSLATRLGALAISVWALALGGVACSPTDEPAPADGPAAAGAELPAGDGAAPAVDGGFVGDGILSADAKVSTFEMLLEDLAATPDVSDGGGRVELVRAEALDGGDGITVGRPARFELRYTAGPYGIAEGGTIFLQSSPFWDWSSPQIVSPDLPGYTEVSTDAGGVELESAGTFESVVAFTIRGRALAEGEHVDFVYGAGEAGAFVDRYRERGAEISISVDGDGDGYRRLVPVGARVDVGPGPPSQLVVTGPTVVRPGARFTVHAHVVDALGNAGLDAPGTLAFSLLAPSGDASPMPDLPSTTRIEPGRGAAARVELVAPAEPGVLRVLASGGGALDGIEGVSNPIVVHATAPRVLWGDLHGHSQLSDGTGTPDDYFAYARDVAHLDVSALTDHDHWGLRFLDAHPETWAEIRASVARHHAPGEFVTLLGYEWTSWLHGHRHVLYFEDDGPVLSSMDPDYATPARLWDGLRGRPALTFAHHSAGGPVSTNWAYGADPELEPVTEIVSVHGSSESADTPGRIYSPVPGNTVRDVLQAGLRLGFIGSGDSHDGHPGLAHLAAPGALGGLAAILAEERTRTDVLDALRARRTYATSGARIWLQVEIDGHPMGTTLPPADEGADAMQTLRIEVAATAPIERVDLVRSGRTATIEVEPDTLELTHERRLPRLARGEFHYVRVVQRDGFAAWSSPIFAD